MRRYAFEVLRGENVLHFEHADIETSVMTDCSQEMWRRISELSSRFQVPGTRIVVRDALGHVVVSIGVVSALRLTQTAA